MPAKVTLSIVQGQLQGQEFVFEDRNSCIMGRSKDCEPRLPNDKQHVTISRHHCLLDINPPDIRVRDFGSLNGTYVNGQKIGQRSKDQSPTEASQNPFPEYDLKDGDQITLGKTIFRVAIYVPAVCAECSAEIPEEHRSQCQIAPNVYQCADCQRKAAKQQQIPKAKARQCAQCGRSVETEVGQHRQGKYVCAACREDPLAVMLHLLEQAKSGRKDLGPINGYTLERKLGEGGFGAVFLARHDASGEHVALKVMLPKVAADARAIEMFSREVQNTKALNHPHVVRLRDAGCSEGTFFFTLDYCTGGTLDHLLKQRGRTLSVEEAVPLMLQALDGLEYAHHATIPNVRLKDGTYKSGQGLVHRDIKPPNFLLHTVEGRLVAKVSDFGLSKAFDTAGLSGFTRSGAVMGTPVFMPRAQVRHFKKAKPEVDVWAAAATLYFLLTGRLVRDFINYPADYPPNQPKLDIWQQILEFDVIPIRQRNSRIPPRLAEVIDGSA